MKSTTVLALLVALAAGAAVGYLVGRNAAPARAPGDLGGGDVRTGREPAGPRPPAPPPVAETSDLGAALDAIPVSLAGRGDGRIWGHVATRDGKPLAGVLVKAMPLWEKGTGTADTLEEEVVEFVKRRRWEKSAARSAVTDSTGAYSIDGLAAARYWVNGTLDGYAIFLSGSGRVEPDAEANLQAMPQATVRVTVLLPDGSAPERASLVFSRGGSTMRNEWTSSRREVTVDPGTWKVVARAGPGGEMVSGEEEIEVGGAGATAAVTLRLRARPGLRGRVRFEDGLVDGDVRVAILPVPAGTEVDLGRLADAPNQKWLSGPGGLEYSYPDLAPGDWVIGAVQGGRVTAHEVVTVVDRMVERDLVVPAPAPEDYVIVAVTGPNGESLDGVRISTGYRSRSSSSSGGSATIRLPDGTWRVRHQPMGASRLREDGRFYVTVDHPRYGKKTVEYVPGKDSRLEVSFEDPARAVVTVAGARGSPYATELSVGLAPWEGEHTGRSGYPSKRLDAEGRAEIEALPPGLYVARLSLVSGDGFGRTIPIAEERVELAPGENRVSLVLPPLFDLVVRTDVRIGLDNEDRSVHVFPREPEEGRVVFRGLPAGTYVIRGYGEGGSGQMEVKVPGPAEVEYVAVVPDALLVSIKNPAGGLALAGFRDGDLIIGVNGEECADVNALQAKLMLAMSKEGPDRLLVLRGGTRLEVSFDLNRMRSEGESLGGSLRPASR